jgi:NhaA family Na+:H+ antiporter
MAPDSPSTSVSGTLPVRPRRRAAYRVLRPFQEFARRGVLGGLLLILCTGIALAWANSPFWESYQHLWETPLTLGRAGGPLTLSLHHWINDGLMAVFFLLVGLEIKRELLVGELASPRQAALPIAAAIGGMVLPALFYTLLNAGTPGQRGWGIPMATDIAFALGVLTLMGPRVPTGLKIFLTALAIVDDMGAVLVIALFYTSSLNEAALLLAALIFAALLLLGRLGVRALTPYLAGGVLLWLAVLASGVHATVAGVLLALSIPSRTTIDAKQFSNLARRILDDFDRSETGDLLVITSRGQQEAVHALELAAEAVQAPLLRLEHSLHGAVSYVIMPLFALANAGVHLSSPAAYVSDLVTLGVVAGLVVGKPLGILGCSWLAVRLGLARLPAGVSWAALHGVGWLGGIGFTMSLFVAGLAFGNSSELDAAKVGILGASLIAGSVGWLLISRQATRTR